MKRHQSNRVSDFRDFVCSLFPKAILIFTFIKKQPLLQGLSGPKSYRVLFYKLKSVVGKTGLRSEVKSESVCNDEHQQEQGSRAKHSRVTYTCERSQVFLSNSKITNHHKS